MHFQSGYFSKLGQLCFPQMDSRPIASDAIAIDIESLCVRVCLFANVKPPLQDTVDRKFCRIMTCSEIYESSIIPNIVYSVWGYCS